MDFSQLIGKNLEHFHDNSGIGHSQSFKLGNRKGHYCSVQNCHSIFFPGVTAHCGFYSEEFPLLYQIMHVLSGFNVLVHQIYFSGL